MIKNKLKSKKIKNSILFAIFFTVFLAHAQIAVAQITAPSDYPIIGSAAGQTVHSLPLEKPLKYKIATRPQYGTVILLDELAGIYQYRSHPGYVGTDSFSLTGEIRGSGIITGVDVFINVTETIQYKVTKTENTQDGICDNDCSFSEAVEAANANPGIDVIVIPAGEYSTNLQTITDHVIIDGENIDQTFLIGNGFRTNGANLHISNLTYTGNFFSSAPPETIPFITNIGQDIQINLHRVSIAETIGFNSLFPSENNIGKMLVFESEFLKYGCGAVLVGNEITASRIAITEGGIGGTNCSNYTGFAAIATQPFSSPGTINLFSSSIHNNFSMPYGLITLWPGNIVTSFNMINASIHNNAGTVFGALVQMWGNTEANIINSTIVENHQAPTFFTGLSSTAWLSNSILAYNNNGGNECALSSEPSIISRGNNFFTNSDNNCNLHPSDIINNMFSYDIDADYHLPLASFQYIMPAYNQANVIDGANDAYCPHTDIQRFQRPADGNADGLAQCDIGAYEILSKKLAIFANDMDDYLVLNTSAQLDITIALSTKDLLSTPAEWWIYADTPMGSYYFDSVTDSWQPGQGVSFQQIISEPDFLQVLPANGFPEGMYKFYFTIDTTIDGINNNMDNAVNVAVFLEPPKSCDANGDDYIDRNDIALILMARNTAASGDNDPRDNDKNGTITILDARQCVLQCTINNCETQEP